jgi:hypothetical protein
MPSLCYVSARDYARYWGDAEPSAPARWDGPERRTGPKDRRRPGHERRWEGTRGRRFRYGDRRHV